MREEVDQWRVYFNAGHHPVGYKNLSGVRICCTICTRDGAIGGEICAKITRAQEHAHGAKNTSIIETLNKFSFRPNIEFLTWN